MAAAITGGQEYRRHLLDLLSSIQTTQTALRRWDAAAFERAVTEQQRICDLLQRTQPAADDREAHVLLSQVRAALRTYHLVIDRGTRWCNTLNRILDQSAAPQGASVRSEL